MTRKVFTAQDVLDDFYSVFDENDLGRKTSFVGEEIQYMPRNISRKESAARRYRDKAYKLLAEADRHNHEALLMRQALAETLCEHPSFFFASRNKGRIGLAGWANWDTVGGAPVIPAGGEASKIRHEINRSLDRRLTAFHAEENQK